MTPMAEFLQAVAPQLAALLRATADYLEAQFRNEESVEDFLDDAPPLIYLNEHGEVVTG
jgi:hypothetical protein